MTTPCFSRHRRVHATLRRISRTLLPASLLSILSLNSTPIHATGRVSTVALPSFTANTISALQVHVDAHDTDTASPGTYRPMDQALLVCDDVSDLGWPPPGITPC